MLLRRTLAPSVGPRTTVFTLARHARLRPQLRPYTVAGSDNVDLYASKEKSLSVRDIHRYYPTLVDEIRQSRSKVTTGEQCMSRPLSEDQILKILELLAASGHPADLQAIETILSDASPVFGIEPSLEMHTSVLRGLIEHGNPLTIQRWLSGMSRYPGHFQPTLEHIHMVLQGCTNFATFKFMRNIVISMRSWGCRPRNETYEILINSRWRMASNAGKIPHLSTFESLISDMQLEGLKYSQVIADLLYNGYQDLDMKANAELIRSKYEDAFSEETSPENRQQGAWADKLSHISQTQGIQGAIALFRTLEREGCSASPRNVKSIIRHSITTGDLYLVEKELGIKCDRSHWSIVVTNNVRAGKLQEALAIYYLSREAGIQPDAALVGPLIKELCTARLKPPSDSSLNEALVLYKHLTDVSPSHMQEAPKRNYLEHSKGPDADIYHTLLRGLASSGNRRTYHSVVSSLFEDMKSRNIDTANSYFASTLVVLSMQTATNNNEALAVYHDLRSSLDEKGYAIVLNAFTKLSFGDECHVPSLKHYFGMVRDMRDARLPVTLEVYTIMLRQIGVIATHIAQGQVPYNPDLHDELVLTTRRTHDLLTLDASVSPDAHIWNQLMDTYQRLGCFADAYRVWDMMFLTGRFDHISVSIILDACGYVGTWEFAKKIRSRLHRENFMFDLHNWNTWLECLCRLGRLSEAVEAACTGMGKAGNNVHPDEDSARILIKFSRRIGQEVEVQDRLKKFLPELWEIIPDDLKRLSQRMLHTEDPK